MQMLQMHSDLVEEIEAHHLIFQVSVICTCCYYLFRFGTTFYALIEGPVDRVSKNRPNLSIEQRINFVGIYIGMACLYIPVQ